MLLIISNWSEGSWKILLLNYKIQNQNIKLWISKSWYETFNQCRLKLHSILRIHLRFTHDVFDLSKISIFWHRSVWNPSQRYMSVCEYVKRKTVRSFCENSRRDKSRETQSDRFMGKSTIEISLQFITSKMFRRQSVSAFIEGCM